MHKPTEIRDLGHVEPGLGDDVRDRRRNNLDTMLRDPKNPLYEAEEISDLVDYFRSASVGEAGVVLVMAMWKISYPDAEFHQRLCWL